MTVFDLVITDPAREDLSNIRTWTVENWGHGKADAYMAQFKTAFATLCENPEIGVQKDYFGRRLRSIAVGRHQNLYRIEGSIIYILRVLHERMDPDRHLSIEE